MVIEKRSLFFGIIIISLFFIGGTDAGVYFSQLNSIYNLGDSIDLNMSIDSIANSPFKLKLFCNDRSVDVFSGPAIENLVLPLTTQWINDLRGSCYFLVDYAGEIKKTTPDFIITDKLYIVLDTDSFFGKPDEILNIAGNVTRANGEGEYGEVEISVPFKGAISSESENNSNIISNESIYSEVSDKFYGKVINGRFLVSLKLPSDVVSGDYVLMIKAYDKSSSGEFINKVDTIGKIKVPQILKSIDVALNNQMFDPGQNITIKPSLFDQANKSIIDTSLILILNSGGEKIYNQVVGSDETGIYEIPFDLSSGYYSIEASNGEKSIKKSVFINEKAKLLLEVRNNTLYLKNIGNAKYNKEIQVDIDGKPFIKKIELDIGEEKELYLSGDNKNSSVKVSDGESSLDTNILLTGKSIDVRDFVGFDIGNLFSNPLIWISLILIISIIITLFMRKIIKRKSIAKPSDYYGRPRHLKLEGVMKKNNEKSGETMKAQIIRRKLDFVPVLPPTEAVQGFVTKGSRNVAVVIALKIKNKITPFAKEFVQKAVNNVYSRKGAVYEHGEYVIGIFSPIATKTFKNEVIGARVAEDICNFLFDYNQKFKDNIEFGIGVNSGEIINEIKDGKLLFTALGNTVVFAKKLAEFSNKEVLLSEDVYHKGMPEIQADKKTFGEVISFKIKKILDHEKSKKFINDFLKRAEKDSGVKYIRSNEYSVSNKPGVINANSLVKTSIKESNESPSLDIFKKNETKKDFIGSDYVDYRV